MNKKILISSLLLLVTLIVINYNKYDVKKEYEKLNNKKDYIKVSIPKDNVFQNINSKELTKKIKETSVIFIGSAKNQASRNSINSLSKAAENTGIDKIYYIDFKKIKNKKIIKKHNINQATLLVFKNGSKKEYINNSNNKMTKKELKKKYEEAINQVLICNPSGDTC
ncbi:MAG: hypothetical protein IKF91_01095 [Bacilli bacterium]|nr:hypothetical protein [Bacilli bacterium]